MTRTIAMRQLDRVFIVAAIAMLASCDLGRYDGTAGAPGGPGSTGGRYHPGEFALAEVHGPESTLQVQDCRGCHGPDLTGNEVPGVGVAPGCDGCHTPAEPAAWRSDCTFCHGGSDDDTGAPPRNLDGTIGAGAVFAAHAVHVNAGDMAPAFDCVQCHVKAVDVITVGHAFDDTAGIAEVDLAGGLSGQGLYEPQTGCSSNYCHGSGRADDGVVATSAAPMTCTSCHPGTASSASQKNAMSGTHGLHLGLSGVTCGECHEPISLDGVNIVDVALHIDGKRDVGFAQAGFAMNRDTMTCTGSCHGRDHQGLPWGGGDGSGSIHPPGYSAGSVHGPEMELQRSNCRGCHGTNLTGGSGPSCDGCHNGAQATTWRSSCTFCHGGSDNVSGAPPRDLGSLAASASLSFQSHTAHVETRMSAAVDCAECHTQPTDVLSTGHAFDATLGVAEVRLAGRRSPAGTYSDGTCSNLYCHGNGITNGTIRDGTPLGTCASCHAARPPSGEHGGPHREYGCPECHRSVAASSTTLANPALHIDGVNQVSFIATGVIWSPGTRQCSGPCHGENHSGERW